MLTTLGDLLLQLWIWWVILPPTGSSPNLKWLWPCQDTVALRNKSGNKSIRSEMDRQAPLSLGFYSAQSVISLSVCVWKCFLLWTLRDRTPTSERFLSCWPFCSDENTSSVSVLTSPSKRNRVHAGVLCCESGFYQGFNAAETSQL